MLQKLTTLSVYNYPRKIDFSSAHHKTQFLADHVSPVRGSEESHVRGSFGGPEREANLHRMGQRCLQQPVRELDAMDRGQIPGLVWDRQQSLVHNQRCLAFHSLFPTALHTQLAV